eukprot:759067-Hanusia_phi.AAC.6
MTSAAPGTGMGEDPSCGATAEHRALEGAAREAPQGAASKRCVRLNPSQESARLDEVKMAAQQEVLEFWMRRVKLMEKRHRQTSRRLSTKRCCSRSLPGLLPLLLKPPQAQKDQSQHSSRVNDRRSNTEVRAPGR